jgi:hypothetical protein
MPRTDPPRKRVKDAAAFGDEPAIDDFTQCRVEYADVVIDYAYLASFLCSKVERALFAGPTDLTL